MSDSSKMAEEKTDQMRSWQEFTNDSSMHGIRYVTMSDKSLLRRGVWLFGIIVAISYFLWATSLFMRDYSKRLVSTTVKVKEADNLMFPTVTICNRNSWRRSALLELNRTNPDIGGPLLKIIPDMYFSHGKFEETDSYNWSDPKLAALIQGEGRELVANLLLNMSHAVDESFQNCLLEQKLVNCSTIFTYVNTNVGRCFQLNSDGKFNVSVAGASGSLIFLMNAQTSEYFPGPRSFSEGFSVVFHDKDEIPLVEELSYGLTPGFETHIMIQKKELRRKPPPADDGEADCFDTENLPNPLLHYKAYTQSACFAECKVAFVIKSCGCRNIFQPALNNSEACNLQQMISCSVLTEYEFLSDPKYRRECNCKSNCNVVQYSAKISSYRFPGSLIIDYYSLPHEYAEYMARNNIQLQIAYAEMTYDVVEEKFPYSAIDLIANMGGTLGVCIGGSFLTLLEFIEFAVLRISLLLLKRKVSGDKTTSVQPYVND